MKPITLAEVLYYLRPDAQFTYQQEDYNTINWIVLEGNPPTAEEISAAHDSLFQARSNELQERAARKSAILERLGLTAEEAAVLLG